MNIKELQVQTLKTIKEEMNTVWCDSLIAEGVPSNARNEKKLIDVRTSSVKS